MAVEKTTKITESEKIWEEIKDLPISVFALPNQRVHNYVSRQPIPGKVLYVKLSTTGVLPALETAIGNKYSVELTERGYIKIARVSEF